jgi:predicted enzyme related to lactoylglutathione lyase
MSIGINIGSGDPKRLVDYYTKLFGAPLFEGAGYASWQVADGLVTVGPHDEVEGRNTQPGRVMWNILTLDAKSDFERYKAAGAIVVRDLYQDADAPEFWIATFSDPDDNYFQIVSRVEPTS